MEAKKPFATITSEVVTVFCQIVSANKFSVSWTDCIIENKILSREMMPPKSQ